MAYSSQRAVSDGTMVLLAISINYTSRSEISVLINDTKASLGTEWNWVGATDKSISFPSALVNGTEVTVLRSTSLADPRNIFTLGAAFTTESLDENFRQLLNIEQEARENAALVDIFNDINLHGYAIRNVGLGVADTDVANMKQLNDTIVDADAILAAQTALYNNFAARYLGPKSTAPTTDNLGGALLEGALYWNISQTKMHVWSAIGNAWLVVGGGAGATGAIGNPVFYENDQVVTGDYTIPTGKNAHSAGPITIAPGVEVSFEPNSSWTIS